MLTRKKQKILNEQLAEQRMTLQHDIQLIYQSFAKLKRPAPKKRECKAKRKKIRIN